MSVNKLAQKVINAYAHDSEGLTREECEGLGLGKEQAELLSYVLDKGEYGEITPEEKVKLAAAQFDSKFIDEIAGVDGNLALRERVKWLTGRIAVVSDRRNFRKVEFISELAKIGALARRAVPALIATLQRDEQNYAREAAALALGRVGRESAATVPALIAALKDRSSAVRRGAACALGEIGLESPGVIRALTATLKDRITDVRANAAGALYKINPDGEFGFRSLLKMLQDKDPHSDDLREMAAFALRKVVPPGPGVVHALLAAVEDPQGYVSQAAFESLEALARRNYEAAIALATLLNDGKGYYRMRTLDAFRHMNGYVPMGQGFVHALLAAVEDPQEYVSQAAFELLKSLASWNYEAAIGLATLLNDGKERYRIQAADAFRDMGDVVEPAVLIVEHLDTRKKVFARLEATAADSFEHKALSARLEAMREISYEFFLGVDFEFIPDCGGGHYDEGNYRVVLCEDSINLSSFAHELAHHWDINLVHDKSRLFERISWGETSEDRYISGNTYNKNGLEKVPGREDFDRADFEREYGLCNPLEDLATVVEGYVAEGRSFRQMIREAMDLGNFELAAKYLFVKQVMPFAGKEYGVDTDSPALTIEEVKQKYVAAKDTSKSSSDTYNIILKMERNYPPEMLRTVRGMRSQNPWHAGPFLPPEK